MEFEMYEMEAEEVMAKSIENYEVNLSRISTGRANPNILNSVKVDYYGTMTPVTQLANISIPEARQLLIKPYEVNINKEIVSAINSSSLSVNAIDEGDKTRINFPELTTERRRELVKSLAKFTEQAKVSIRKVRQDANKSIKNDEELTDDDQKNFLELIQKMTDNYINKVNYLTTTKEEELMKI